MSRYIDADGIQYTMLYKENWITNTGVEKQGVWKDDIDKIPTADVRENIMGKWIEDNHREKSMMWRCSVCGRIAYYPTIGERKSYKKHCGYNFCPNCGADMRGEDNGRDEENHNRV